MNGVSAAFAATAFYYVGFPTIKVAGDRMEPLRGSRPFRMAVVLLTHPLWLLGLTLLLSGAAFQIIALSILQLGAATPMLVTGLTVTLIVAVAVFGERLTFREWLSLLLIGTAMLLVSLSVGNSAQLAHGPLAYWKILAIMVPAMAFPYLLVALDDRRPDGRHAKRITGVAYGVTAGFPLGTAELAIRGMADHLHDGVAGLFATPYPYVMVITGGLAYGIIMLGFQRYRFSVVISVATIIAKTYLLVMGTVLFGEPWPDDLRNAALRVGGLVLTAVAVMLFPHYDPAAHKPREASGEPEPAAIAADAPSGAELSIIGLVMDDPSAEPAPGEPAPGGSAPGGPANGGPARTAAPGPAGAPAVWRTGSAPSGPRPGTQSGPQPAVQPGPQSGPQRLPQPGAPSGPQPVPRQGRAAPPPARSSGEPGRKPPEFVARYSTKAVRAEPAPGMVPPPVPPPQAPVPPQAPAPPEAAVPTAVPAPPVRVPAAGSWTPGDAGPEPQAGAAQDPYAAAVPGGTSGARPVAAPDGERDREDGPVSPPSWPPR